MNDNKFKLLLGGIALAADSLFFDSFLSKIKEELLQKVKIPLFILFKFIFIKFSCFITQIS